MPDSDAARDLGDAVVAQAPALLGGLPAARYDLRYENAAVESYGWRAEREVGPGE